MTFQECCIQCAGNAELVKEFNRLSDAKLGGSRNPFEIAIDNACGYEPNNCLLDTSKGLVKHHI